jgi:phosphoribosylformylglycinamidine (FGAM) synthase-like enzyme
MACESQHRKGLKMSSHRKGLKMSSQEREEIRLEIIRLVNCTPRDMERIMRLSALWECRSHKDLVELHNEAVRRSRVSVCSGY